MPVETPVLVRNLRNGPTVFDDGQRIEWAGFGDVSGEDVQPVPFDLAFGNVSLVRCMALGVFEVAEGTLPELRVRIEEQVALARRHRPNAKVASGGPGLINVFEMVENDKGLDKETIVVPTIEPLTRG